MRTVFIFCAYFCLYASATAQKFTVSGTVKDKDSGENLIGANVYNSPSSQGTAANVYGFFSLTLAKDSVRIRISYVGYEPQNFVFLLKKDTVIKAELKSTLLEEVVVSSSEDEAIQQRTSMGTIDLPVAQIKAMPAFMGEVDVLKVLQLMPGVQSGSEGSSGLYVRGGGPDQNLMLLDGVPVYNASHLFGFFSVFNADAINHVELIKGGFPARYGGRLSSVVDIRMKEGNTKALKGEGSVGLIASKLTLEGPINSKTSFIISGRRTYIDLLARPFMSSAQLFGYYFYDLNVKINHRFNDRNWLYLSTYAGEDKGWTQTKTDNMEGNEQVHKDERASLKWGNIITALRWNHIFNDKLFSNLTATYSRYNFGVQGSYSENDTNLSTNETTYSDYRAAYTSGIRDLGLKLDFDYIPAPAHYIRFGAHATRHLFTPGILGYHSQTQTDTTYGAQRIFTNEYLAYVEDDLLVTDRLKVNVGVNASASQVAGTTFSSIQPRISARYLLNANVSLKASYAQMVQYLHLLTNAGIGLPTDLWVPATPLAGPERSAITSIGAAYNVNSKYEFSVEGYYKTMTGLIEYKNGASYLNIDRDWQNKIEIGDGESHGAEVFLQRKTGRLSGWIGYTLSWTNRTFANLNNGKTFPYRYDRRHDVSIAMMYKVKEGRDISLTWVYGSGNAVSLPVSKYQSAGAADIMMSNSYRSIEYYDSRNGYRMNAYHRLDLSYNWTKKKKWGERTWSLSVYNVYNHQNPFFINREQNSSGMQKFVQYSLFPIIPSIAYRFKF